MKGYALLFIAILLPRFTNAEYVETDKRNLDPNKGCVKPTTREELQFAINVLLSTANPNGDVPIELVLCKDTDVIFKDGDPRIQMLFKKEDVSFVMRCKIKKTCRITGGYHNGRGRNFLGSAGFLEMSAITNRGFNLSFEGIKFSDFGVTNDGGVFLFYTNGNLQVQFIHCTFHRNRAGISGGVALCDAISGEIEILIKHCLFKENEADRYGGVFAFRTPIGFTHTIIEHSEFIGNKAKADGGVAAYGTTFSNHQLVAKYSKFEDNIAIRDGGVFFFYYLTPVEIKDCEFKNNEAGTSGSAYFAIDSEIITNDSNFNADTLQSYVSDRFRRF